MGGYYIAINNDTNITGCIIGKFYLKKIAIHNIMIFVRFPHIPCNFWVPLYIISKGKVLGLFTVPFVGISEVMQLYPGAILSILDCHL